MSSLGRVRGIRCRADRHSVEPVFSRRLASWHLALLLPPLLCLPAPAQAHGSLAVGDFYTGMLDPLLHFESLLLVLVLALWAGQLAQRLAWQLPLGFVLAALLGTAAGLLGYAPVLGSAPLRLALLALGLLVAARLRLPVALAVPAAVVLGFAEGQQIGFDPQRAIARPGLFLAGLGVGLGLVFFHIVTRLVRYRPFWLQIGVRVLGSWMAAAALLVLVLEWVGPR